MKHYYVDVNGGVAIVKATSIEKAEEFSIPHFGAIHVRFVRLASEVEIDWYKVMGGVIHEADNVSV